MAIEIIDILRAELEQAQYRHQLAEAEFKRVREYTRLRLKRAARQRNGARKSYSVALRHFSAFVRDGKLPAGAEPEPTPESRPFYLGASETILVCKRGPALDVAPRRSAE